MTQKNPVPVVPSRIFSYCFPSVGVNTQNKKPKKKTHNQKLPNKNKTNKKTKTNKKPQKQTEKTTNNETPPQNQTKLNYAIIWFLSLDTSQFLAYPDNDSLNFTIMKLFDRTLFPAITSFICVQN